MGKMCPLILVLALFGCPVWSASWSYHGSYAGPSNWTASYPICGQSSQSPIDIKEMDAEYDKDLGNFKRFWFDGTPTAMTLSNDGHSAKVTVERGSKIEDSTVLNGNFEMAQFHFHWGSATTKGSEHELNGDQYFAELHAVFYNKKYDTFGAAADKTDGLAVLGFFIDKGASSDHAGIKKITDKLATVVNKDSKHVYATADRFPLSSLIPDTMGKFYRYSGSLTTPSCYQSVTWTVFENRIQISDAQAKLFYALKTGNEANSTTIVDNFRPVQPLNGRKIYHNSASGAAISLFVACLMSILSTIIVS